MDLHGARARATWFCFRWFLIFGFSSGPFRGIFFLVLLSKTKARRPRFDSISQGFSSARECRQAPNDAGDVEPAFAKVQRGNWRGDWGAQWAKPNPANQSADASRSWRSNAEAGAGLLLISDQCLREGKHWHCLSPCPRQRFNGMSSATAAYSGQPVRNVDNGWQWQKALTLFRCKRQKGTESVGLDDAGS